MKSYNYKSVSGIYSAHHPRQSFIAIPKKKVESISCKEIFVAFPANKIKLNLREIAERCEENIAKRA